MVTIQQISPCSRNRKPPKYVTSIKLYSVGAFSDALLWYVGNRSERYEITQSNEPQKHTKPQKDRILNYLTNAVIAIIYSYNNKSTCVNYKL